MIEILVGMAVGFTIFTAVLELFKTLIVKIKQVIF